MKAVLLWFRIDFRHRWQSMLVLAVLIAIASSTIVTALSGAARAATSVDRLRSATLPATIVALPNQPGFDWEPIKALPDVEAVGEFAISVFSVDEVPDAEFTLGFPVMGPDIYRTIEKPVVFEGRMLDPTRPDEVMASPAWLNHYGFAVGDPVTIRLYLPEQIDEFDTTDVGPPGGPVIQGTIVGSVRSWWYSDQSEGGFLTPSPALFEQYPDNFLGAQGYAYINALLRLRNGADDIPQFKEDIARISGRTDIDVWDLEAAADDVKNVIAFEVRSLQVFALAALIAALLLIGQAVARHVASVIADTEPLRAVGMTPNESRLASTLAPMISAIVGIAVALPVAYIASEWFPVGTASWVESAPGRHANWMIFGLGAVVILALVATGSFAVSTVALSSRRRSARVRRSVIATSLARAGMPVPVVTGSRFALEPGRGAASVPVRPALFGAIFGVLGIVAVFTFANGIHDTVNSPARFGQTWDLSAFAGLNGEDFIPAAETGAAIANDPDVRAINDVRLNVAQINGDAVSMLTLDPVDQPLDIVLTEGAIASRKGEITIGPRTADATGLGTGDTVEVTGSHGTQTLTVTGIGFLFPSPHNDYASGGWVTPETYDSLFDGFKFHFFIVDVADGASPSDVSERLGAMGIGLDPNEQFGEQRQLLQIQSIPWFLAGFLALLGIGAVGHALVTAVRRRRHELAVLRALGMTPPQSGAVVAAQATTLTLAGLVIGVPLGVALGRTLWHYVADLTPVYYVPPVAVLALVLIAPISLLASNVLAVRPSFRAANMQLGEELRTE